MVCITAITIYEVNIGLDRTKRKKSEKRYNELKKKWLDFISGMEILSIKAKDAENASKIFDDLETKGKIIEDNDILIAGVFLSNGISKILTRNSEHFEFIDRMTTIEYEF